MGSGNKTNVSNTRISGYHKGERHGGSDWHYIHRNHGVRNSKMGEIAVKVLNVLGITAIVFGFLANINNFVAILLGITGLAYGIFKAADMYEVWKVKQWDRHERERKRRKEDAIVSPD